MVGTSEILVAIIIIIISSSSSSSVNISISISISTSISIESWERQAAPWIVSGHTTNEFRFSVLKTKKQFASSSPTWIDCSFLLINIYKAGFAPLQGKGSVSWAEVHKSLW